MKTLDELIEDLPRTKPKKRHKTHPAGYWGPRAMAVVRAKNWTTAQAATEFGCGWPAIKRVIEGGSPRPSFVQKLVKLEERYAADISITQAAIEYRAGRMSVADYNQALADWVDATNRKIRPGDLAEVGMVGDPSERDDAPRLLRLVQAPPKRRYYGKRNTPDVPGRREDTSTGSDATSEGAPPAA